nr:hypothetical protein [Tanacetum cinerariifolium]
DQSMELQPHFSEVKIQDHDQSMELQPHFSEVKIQDHMFLSVDKKYPLTHFTLEQMLNNVRLKVEEESEMSFELLRLVRRQLNEGLSLGSFRRVPSYTAIVPCLTDVETIEFGPGISSKGSASLEYCFGPNIFA